MKLKNTKLNILLLSLSIVFLAGCAMIDVPKVKQNETAAVVMIGVNKNLDMSEMGGGTAGSIQRLVDDESFDLSPMVGIVHNKVHEEFVEQFPITFLPEEEVLYTEEYENFRAYDSKEADERWIDNSTMLVPEDYQPFRHESMSNNQREQLFEAVTDEVDIITFVSVHYYMEDATPFWRFFTEEGVIRVSVNIRMMDRNGDTVARIAEAEESEESIKMVGGVTIDPEKIEDLSKAATEKAFQSVYKFTQEELRDYEG